MYVHICVLLVYVTYLSQLMLRKGLPFNNLCDSQLEKMALPCSIYVPI